LRASSQEATRHDTLEELDDQTASRPAQPREERAFKTRSSREHGHAAILMIGVGVAGCAGSSSPSTGSTTTPAITKAEFLTKANAICGKADPVLSAAGAKLETKPSEAQVAVLVKGTYVPSIQAQISGIKALGVPAGEQASVTSLLALAQADLNKLQSNPALIATDVFADFAKVAHPYGLTACAPTS
jgi:hypothetical protein